MIGSLTVGHVAHPHSLPSLPAPPTSLPTPDDYEVSKLGWVQTPIYYQVRVGEDMTRPRPAAIRRHAHLRPPAALAPARALPVPASAHLRSPPPASAHMRPPTQPTPTHPRPPLPTPAHHQQDCFELEQLGDPCGHRNSLYYDAVHCGYDGYGVGGTGCTGLEQGVRCTGAMYGCGVYGVGWGGSDRGLGLCTRVESSTTCVPTACSITTCVLRHRSELSGGTRGLE